jgi:hypothetical protein
MKKYSILILVISLVLGSAHAQVKVKSDGRTYLKGFRSTDDYNNEVSVQVYGKYGSSLTNGRLAIGDYGSMANSGGNVFIGEYGTNVDSDILQLQGKKGIYLTRGTGTPIGYYDVSSGNKFTFNCDVYSYSIKLTSDERFKTNVKALDSALVKLNRLNGVS